MTETATSRVALPASSERAPARGPLSLRWVTTTDAFDALGDAWARLHASCDSTAFQSYEWQRAWWRHFGEGNPRLRLQIGVCERAGEVVAIAPFVITRARAFGLVGLEQLELLGKGVSDYLDLLVAPGLESGACEMLAEQLTQLRSFEVVSWVDVPDPSPLKRILLPALRRTGWMGSEEVREQCPRTALLETWQATLASFEDSHRKRVAYLDRKLKKNLAVEVRRAESEPDLDAALDSFIAMHQRRWVSAGEPGAFADARAVAFHREVARAFQRRGWLSLSFLVLNGRPATANYAFKVSGKLEFYLSGAADYEEARKFAPGILLHAYCMQQMIGEGVRIYDFLRGTERYKYELGAKDVANWALLAFRPGASITRLKHRLHVLHRKLGASAKRAMTKVRSGKA